MVLLPRRAISRAFNIESSMEERTVLAVLGTSVPKMLLNFTWEVRKDHDRKDVFEGGFLGLDNIVCV